MGIELIFIQKHFCKLQFLVILVVVTPSFGCLGGLGGGCCGSPPCGAANPPCGAPTGGYGAPAGGYGAIPRSSYAAPPPPIYQRQQFAVASPQVAQPVQAVYPAQQTNFAPPPNFVFNPPPPPASFVPNPQIGPVAPALGQYARAG
ncbi:hypothetical protein AB6A40_001306 [Gnathostoma spinigerum]|uniref:Uncharacterized protein n=1 Tax=Gnathostoma spinigerum TaxID=75299 RepID=A0ABD6ED32_9BILA